MAATSTNIQKYSALLYFISNFRKHLFNFHKSLFPNDKKFDTIIKISICLAMVSLVAIDILFLERISMVREEMRQNPYGRAFMLFALIFIAINIVEFLWRFYLVCKYKPVSSSTDDELLSCSVVVPAFNEGKQVYMTLKSLAESDYPLRKLQIIAVDDGSVDDTWEWISKAKQELGSKLMAIKLPQNKGKRHALYLGFQQSTGDVLVTVDSDSEVKPDTLRNLISPFVKNSKIGGVAGNIRVLNLNEGIIPKMLDVIFLFSFDFIRASQSMVNTVMCTPGALSAYRKDVVTPILSEWLNQTFLGRPSTIGEDRAMTNLIVREGYNVFYQQNAVAFTNVPVGYTNLCKMLLRWARSHIRETIVMARFIFKKFRKHSALGARINFILNSFGIILSPLFIFVTIAFCCWHIVEFGISILIGIIFTSSAASILYTKRCGNSDGLFAYLYGVFVLVSLSWISAYSLVTVHHSGWLTRGDSSKTGKLSKGKYRVYFNSDGVKPLKQFPLKNNNLSTSCYSDCELKKAS
ncbi:MAG: glycosyltransferase family 2 protein [Proteobacteria bacterium]|nr:glycosyltransferase family 2 protein [Pseudomonadota bacterium]MBU4037312.1 glycosyltransferase family 2 protein [Pseudomonadota bacterium]